MKTEQIVSSILWGVLFIVGGVLLLLDSLGVMDFDLSKWWPAIFIVIGANIILSGIINSVSRK